MLINNAVILIMQPLSGDSMLVKDLEELKSFIEWAKSHKITRIKLGEVEIDVLPLSYVESQLPPDLVTELQPKKKEPELPKKAVPDGAGKTWVDTIQEQMDKEDPDLFFSAR